MNTLTLRELEETAGAFDASAEATPGISTYCSSCDWVLAAHAHLHPKRIPRVFRDGDHWVAMAEATYPNGVVVWEAIEASWGFACPLIGPDPTRSTELLADVLQRDRPPETPVLISGVPAGSPSVSIIAETSVPSLRMASAPGADCALADLDRGFEAYLTARTVNFRRTVRRARRDCENAGVCFEYITAPAGDRDIMKRVLAVDRRSARYGQGKSIFQSPSHCRFYAALAHRAAAHGRLRALFAKVDNEDVAFYFGARLGGTFRGFQMGYDETFARCGLGNATHLELIRRLCEEGVATYDLGIVMDYKHRWSDRRLELLNILLMPVR